MAVYSVNVVVSRVCRHFSKQQKEDYAARRRELEVASRSIDGMYGSEAVQTIKIEQHGVVEVLSVVELFPVEDIFCSN